MITKEIGSLQHPFVKHLVKLRKERQYRLEHKSVLIPGKKLVEENGPVRILIAVRGALPIARAPELVLVTPEIMKKITGLENPEPYAALIDLPPSSSLKGCRFLLACDGIADPGNLGTLLRSALALGWEGAFLTEGTTDPFNEKAVRASKGASFRLPLRMGGWQELERLIEENRMEVLVADAHGEALSDRKPSSAPLLLILGNESHGSKESAMKNYPRVSIRMSGKMESLNVAGAGAILMHMLRKL